MCAFWILSALLMLSPVLGQRKQANPLDELPAHLEVLTHASNPVISTDDRFTAFQVAHTADEAGVGSGIMVYRFREATGVKTLEALSDWRLPRGEWMLAGSVKLDGSNPRKLAAEPGNSILVNGPSGKTSDLLSVAEHSDAEVHVEFMVAKGSNSGVYFQGRYEVQILDSYGVKAPTSGDCGGIYQRWDEDQQRGYEGRAPRTNASRAPGEWQSFDVVFRSPRFNAAGKKVRNAVFERVTHNGVLIHEKVEVTGSTRAATFQDEKPRGPLMLQGDHGPVAYRAVRIRPLE